MTPKLTKVTAENVIPLSRGLYKAGLLDTKAERLMRNIVVPTHQRAANLVSLITDKVEQDSQNFHIILEGLVDFADVMDVV